MKRHVFLVLVRDPSSTLDTLFADTVGNSVILFKIGGRQVKVGKGIKSLAWRSNHTFSDF